MFARLQSMSDHVLCPLTIQLKWAHPLILRIFSTLREQDLEIWAPRAFLSGLSAVKNNK